MSDAVAAQPAAFDLTDEQRQVGDLAAEIAQREIAPHIAQWDREHTFSRGLYSKLTAAGIMGLLIPEEFGGAGADYVSYARAIEELARVDAGTAVTVSVHSMICMAILKLGNAEQKRAYLPKLAQDDTIAGFALTEPDAGSDAANIRGTAKRVPGGYVLNGRKQWCTNGRLLDRPDGHVSNRRSRPERRERVSDRQRLARRRRRTRDRKAGHSHEQHVRRRIR